MGNVEEQIRLDFITYIVGAACAGVLVQLSESIGFGVVIAAFPVIYLIFLSYRMYLSECRDLDEAGRAGGAIRECS